MGVQVKICGINSLDAADAALRGGAEFAGLNFQPTSPRYLRADLARVLAERMRGRTQLVAIYCDPPDDLILASMGSLKPDFIQLHGNETADRVAAIRRRFGVQVVKAVAIADASDFAGIRTYEAVADMLLFDAKAPQGATREGGHGSAFDWQLLRGRSFSRPWLLAGGLTPENVGRAIAASGARGVDVSSGVETSPGVKSAPLIAEFLANAKAARFAAESQS